MQPQHLVEDALERTGRYCPQCRRKSLTSRNVEGTDSWAIGQIWCPACDWSMNVFVDTDAHQARYGSTGTVGRPRG